MQKLLIIAIIITFAFSLTPYIDWYNDSALYIIHAKNLLQGINYTDTKLVYNSERIMFPEYYQPLFPLLLTIPLQFFGLDFIALKTINLLFFIFSIIIIIIFFKKHNLTDYSLAILLLANPYTLFFISRWVMSDIVFMFFVFLSLYLHETKNYKLLGLSWTLAIATRSVGVLLPVSFTIFLIYKHLLGEKIPVKKLLLPYSIPLLYIISEKIFLGPQKLHWQFIANTKPSYWIANILSYSKTFFHYLFYFNLKFSKLIALIFFTITIILGLRNKLKTYGLSSIEIFSLLYILLIIIWPGQQGFRFLFPLLLPVSFYFILGLKKLHIPSSVPTLILLLTNIIGYYPFIKSHERIPAGPHTTEAKQVFRKIKQLPEGSVILFEAPRYLVLFTGKPSVAYNYNEKATPQKLRQFISKYKVKYILLSTDFPANYNNLISAVNYVADKKIYDNRRFVLYKIHTE